MPNEAVKTLSINASPATIFPYLVDPTKLILWMGTEAQLDPSPGGEFRVLCAGIHQSAGNFIEIVANEKVVFTFGWDVPGHPIPAGSTEVEITLTPDGDSTIIRLVHRGLPDDAINDHLAGWNYYFDRLDKVLSGLDPGPDVAISNS